MRSRYVFRWGFAVLGLSAVVNLFVAIRVFFAMQSPVAYNIRVIEPPVYTNIVSSLPLLPPMPGEATNDAPRSSVAPPSLGTNLFEVAAESYHYMRVDGSPLFRLNGRNYAVGDSTAYGVVDRIYPERVYFADGGYISNLRRVFDVADFVPLQPSEPSPRVLPREESPHDPS